MTRASAEAQAARTPGSRVYTITRAGMPGCARYAQTWSGDNTTSWHTLRWNQRMGLSMGLSGLFNIGHDIGGFAGPTPDAELLARWMQACALNPRCIMNSWKEDGSVNTPWLHPDATAHIRAAIELRLTLLPYLYSCLHESVRRAPAQCCGRRSSSFRTTRDAGRTTTSSWWAPSYWWRPCSMLDPLRARCISRNRAIRPDGVASIAVRGIPRGKPSRWRRRSSACRCSCARTRSCPPRTRRITRSAPTSHRARCGSIRRLRMHRRGPRRRGWKTTAFRSHGRRAALTRITATLAATADAIQLSLAREGDYRAAVRSSAPRAARGRDAHARLRIAGTPTLRLNMTVAADRARLLALLGDLPARASPPQGTLRDRSHRGDAMHRGLASRPERRGRCARHAS